MSNFNTAIAAENEIMKAVDVTFGYDSTVGNVAIALKAILSNSPGDFVIGGKVKPYGSGGLNVSIEPIYAYSDSTGICVAETDTTEPVSFEETDSVLDRIDIVEVQGVEEGYDLQSRKFNDPSTGTKTTQQVNTKKRIKLSVIVKKGSNGSETAPEVDEGCVKIAEVRIPAGISNISSDLIKNVTARKYGVENIDWTTDTAATFNPSFLANIFYTFLVQHNEDGTHRGKVIKSTNIDFGTGNTQVKGSQLPTGQSMSLHGVDFTSSENVTALIQALVSNANDLYKYSNDLLSRYSFLGDFPAACSTENVDIATGGEMTIDGITCTTGQLVFLKDQVDARENGFYKVKSGTWERYPGYTQGIPMAFKYKLVIVKSGTTNKGKIFYLNGEFDEIGTDELRFKESTLSTYAKAYTRVVRDSGGRIKAAAPVENDDVIRKTEYTTLQSNITAEATARSDADTTLQSKITAEATARSNADTALQNLTNSTFKTALLNFCHPVGSLYWSSKSTNPSTLFGGTWTRIKDRFIWACGDNDTVNNKGGKKTHKLEIDELPPHYHTGNTLTVANSLDGIICSTSYGSATGAFSLTKTDASVGASGNHYWSNGTISLDMNNKWSGQTSTVGEYHEHNNMPPYIVKYCWERTA